jgi:hypothetical protein
MYFSFYTPGVYTIHLVDSARADEKIDRILVHLHTLQTLEHQSMTALTDIQAKLVTLRSDVESETGVVASVKTLLEGQNALLISLRQQLADALATNDPLALQAVLDSIDAITATNAANKQATVDAVVANTPVG